MTYIKQTCIGYNPDFTKIYFESIVELADGTQLTIYEHDSVKNTKTPTTSKSTRSSTLPLLIVLWKTLDINYPNSHLTQEEIVRYRAKIKYINQCFKKMRMRLYASKKRWQYSKSRKRLHNGRLSKRNKQ